MRHVFRCDRISLAMWMRTQILKHQFGQCGMAWPGPTTQFRSYYYYTFHFVCSLLLWANKSGFSVESPNCISILHYCHLGGTHSFLLLLTVVLFLDPKYRKFINLIASEWNPSAIKNPILIHLTWCRCREAKKIGIKKYQQNFEGFFWSSAEKMKLTLTRRQLNEM